MSITVTDAPTPNRVAVRARNEPDGRTGLQAVEVLLVDDDRAASYSLWVLLSCQPGIRVCATAESAANAVALSQRLKPDVCLVSAALGPGEGIRLAHRLSHLSQSSRVLLYADRAGEEMDATAAIADADGAFWRYGDPEELASTIRRVAAGEHRQAAIAAKVVYEVIDRVEDRDRAIVAMLLERIATDKIAGTLGLSARSLRARRREILKRLDQSGDRGSLRRLKTRL